MPPKTRTAKSTKPLKENIGIACKTKLKSTKPPRMVLGDKTNSASDDNASIDIPLKPATKPFAGLKNTNFLNFDDNVARSRRNRRIPSRFAENEVLKGLSNSKENEPVTNSNKGKFIKNSVEPVDKIIINNTTSLNKNDSCEISPFKTPQKVNEISLVANRPRRISRLPSKFEDHSVSPSKFIPVQPCHASTPLAVKATKTHDSNKTSGKEINKSNKNNKHSSSEEQNKPSPKKKVVGKKNIKDTSDSNKKHPSENQNKLLSPKKKVRDSKTIRVIPDSNNNAKGRSLRSRKPANPDDKPSALKSQSEETTSKVNSSKIIKSPVKKITTPVKKISSKTRKSPIAHISPLKHSYLNSVNKISFKVQPIKSPVKPSSPVNKTTRCLRKDLSFKVLEENKKNESNQDIYEFTFDPDEEPVPQKKKRKAVKRKPANPKPKKVIFKNMYDQNVNKALAVLKNAVAKKPTQVNNGLNTQKLNKVDTSNNVTANWQPPSNGPTNIIEPRLIPQVQRNVASKIIIGNTKQSNVNNGKNTPQIQENILLNGSKMQPNVLPNVVSMPEPNQSIRVEDIAADFECSPQHDINYSPIHSPCRPKTPEAQISKISDIHHNDDPLNLRGNISFDPNPIASSSMNTSVRRPQASPWRVEFESLPVRWHVNSYVKANMTPAVECSFVNFDDKNKKKHVYTNLVPQHDDELPEIVQKDQPNLIQSSIISFIKEVVEKSSSKKNRGRSATPVTASLFNDTDNPATNKENEKVKKSTRQLFTPKKNADKARSDTSNLDSSKDVSNDKENSKDSSRGQKRKNNEEPNNTTPAKTPRKEIDNKYFGFDDSENLENVSPQKEVGRKKSLRQARARAVLREINEHKGPTRAVIPVAVKTARKAELDRLYDEMKSACDAPVLSAKEPVVDGATNVIQPIEELDEDSQTSVHLFEDVEDIVHHLKPNRKSYGNTKKVTFVRQDSSDTQDSDLRPEPGSDEEGDLLDPTFNPNLPLLDEEKKKPKKKQTKRQKMTKKEEEEAEAWAAGFNSMCEDVEDFPLVVE